MGAIELQVFVSLVVILGAAFVALICDFLKGNNEQLRESNIEMRVRQDEREKREEILDKVQRHTIETLVQARVAPAPVAVSTPRPAAAQTVAPVPVQQQRPAADLAPDTRETFERTQQDRSARRREGRRQQPPPPVPVEPTMAEPEPVASWAQSVLHKKHAQPVVVASVASEPVEQIVAQPAAPAVVAEAPPPIASTLPVAVRPALVRCRIAYPELTPFQPELAVCSSVPAFLLTAGAKVALRRNDTLADLEMPLAVAGTQPHLITGTDLAILSTFEAPHSGLTVEQPIYEIVEPEAAELAAELTSVFMAEAETEAELPELGSQVVRIRVLGEHDIIPDIAAADEPLELALPVNETEPFQPLAWPEPAVAVSSIEPIVTSIAPQPLLPVAKLGTILEFAPLAIEQPAQPAERALPVAVEEPILIDEPLAPVVSHFEFAAAIPEYIVPVAAEPQPVITSHVELRSNVVEMPVTPSARNIEVEQPVLAELVIPGGFHEAPALARLLEEEAPFNGLAIVISVVDYVRLMADQGKPAAEQLMGSISRLVMSLAREQDLACRIAEDEFVLLFSRETGAAAKRRIQLVSERLWDFQLRSLGSVSVIFSWGAAESTREAVVHAVEHAREQMLESRRNRRALASGVGRFRRRVANS